MSACKGTLMPTNDAVMFALQDVIRGEKGAMKMYAEFACVSIATGGEIIISFPPDTPDVAAKILSEKIQDAINPYR